MKVTLEIDVTASVSFFRRGRPGGNGLLDIIHLTDNRVTSTQPNSDVYSDRNCTPAPLHKTPSLSVTAHSSRGLASTNSLMLLCCYADWQFISRTSGFFLLIAPVLVSSKHADS